MHSLIRWAVISFNVVSIVQALHVGDQLSSQASQVSQRSSVPDPASSWALQLSQPSPGIIARRHVWPHAPKLPATTRQPHPSPPIASETRERFNSSDSNPSEQAVIYRPGEAEPASTEYLISRRNLQWLEWSAPFVFVVCIMGMSAILIITELFVKTLSEPRSKFNILSEKEHEHGQRKAF